MKRGGTKVVRQVRCGLCGKPKRKARDLVVGLHAAVCAECITLWGEKLASDLGRGRTESESLAPLAKLRQEVCRVNRALFRFGLVPAHSGNASGLLPEAGIVVIKPSGVDYGTLSPEDLVAVQLESGKVAEGEKRPSVDLPHHLFLYRNLPGVKGVVHTHSTFATAFAALGKSVPCVLTEIADVFGGDVPCAPYVDNEGDNIGRAILEHRSERSPAILLAHHGVFAWGDSPSAALNAAIMAEHAAKTVYLASQMGKPQRLPKGEIEKWWDRYQNRYGQG